MSENSTSIKMYLGSFFAALTCPCHAIFYVYLLSGTTLGAFLSEHEILFLSVLGLIFPFFIFMVVKSYHQLKQKKEMEKSGEVCSAVCDVCQPKAKS